MQLPVNPPVLPMLAKNVDALPKGEGWIFEPKWDGFRTLIFRDGDELFIQSRDEKPLDRYFPELVEALKAQLPKRCVLDGEIVIARDGALDFEALQLRLHPAASRAKLLASETPASVVFFDLLAEGDRELCSRPFHERRAALESVLDGIEPPLHCTPTTRDRAKAEDWFQRFEGAGLDGVIAKQADGTYQPNKRVMLKVKHERDCDCVVAGFRWHKNGEGTRFPAPRAVR
jgi:ATP-dependent DNA ligase